MHYTRFFAVVSLCGLTAANAIPAAWTQPELQERQIIGGLNCVLGGVVILLQNLLGDPGATAYCQSVLGYTTSTVQVTATTTTNVITTAFVPTATLTSVYTTITANAVTGSPVVTTLTGNQATTTTCVSPNGKAKRQAVTVGVSASVNVVPTPTGLQGQNPSVVSIVCACLNPPTFSPVTATATQTAVSTITTIVDVIVTQSATATVTPTITPTQTVTYIPTATINSCLPAPTPDTSCGNLGMQWALWSNSDPTNLANIPPFFAAGEYPATVAASFSGYCSDPSLEVNIYGVDLPSCAYWSFMHRGFVYAGTAGAYTFSIPQGVDDQLSVWVGDVAIAGWEGSNVALVGVVGGPGAGSSFTYTATAGEFIPLRVLMYQVLGPWGFYLSVTGPSGEVILDGNGQSGALVMYDCGGTANWLPWGAESSA